MPLQSIRYLCLTVNWHHAQVDKFRFNFNLSADNFWWWLSSRQEVHCWSEAARCQPLITHHQIWHDSHWHQLSWGVNLWSHFIKVDVADWQPLFMVVKSTGKSLLKWSCEVSTFDQALSKLTQGSMKPSWLRCQPLMNAIKLVSRLMAPVMSILMRPCRRLTPYNSTSRYDDNLVSKFDIIWCQALVSTCHWRHPCQLGVEVDVRVKCPLVMARKWMSKLDTKLALCRYWIASDEVTILD